MPPEARAPRQNWGKFEAHKCGGFNARSEMLEAVPTDLVFIISLEKRSTQNLQLSTSWPADCPFFTPKHRSKYCGAANGRIGPLTSRRISETPFKNHPLHSAKEDQK